MDLRIRSPLIFIAMLFGTGGVARAQSFELPDEYQLPEVGVVWVAADFDADGDSDIATVMASGALAMATNDGAGGFTVTAAGGGAPVGDTGIAGFTRAAAADFDGDGAVDLLLAHSRVDEPSGTRPCSATLFLNLGAGTFGAGLSLYAVAELPPVSACAALEVGDFDANGAPDIALAFYAIPYGGSGLHGGFNVFLGQGDGTFASPTIGALTGAGDPPYVSLAMAAGDFDSDGSLDLAFGEDIIYLSGHGGSRVQIFSGIGNGEFFPSFTDTVSLRVASSFTAARAEDVTGDGFLDLLLMANPAIAGGYGPSVLPVVLFANAGDGTLSAPVSVAADLGVIGFESTDFDGDAKTDLLLVSAEDRATLIGGDGVGGYSTNAIFSAGGGARALLSGDFDADGLSDFAVLDPERSVFRVAIAELDGPGFPLPRVTPLSTPGDGVYFAPGDFDGDGVMDLLASEYGAFDVLLGTGDGQFIFGAHIASNDYPARPLIADLNHDDMVDLVLPAPGSTFRTLFGSADGTFSGTTRVDVGASGEFPEGALGDFDTDGDLDVAAFSVTGSVRFYTNDGSGNFSFHQEFAVTTFAAGVLFADLNGDSHLDLFVGSSTGTLIANGLTLSPGNSLSFLGDGSGGFTQVVALPAAAADFELGDVNGDAVLDLATNTSVALGRGDGTFNALSAVNPSSREVALSDVNGDGALDLVTLEPSFIGLALGHGDGTFEQATQLLELASSNAALPVLGVADFTGDGEADLFTARVPRLDYYNEPYPELVTIVSRASQEPCRRPRGWPPRHLCRPWLDDRVRPRLCRWLRRHLDFDAASPGGR